MFENYLQSLDTYLGLEKFFFDFFKSKLKELNKDLNSFHTPFYKTTFANGQPFMDGNPIFSARNEKNDTVLRVIIDEDVNDLSSFEEAGEFGIETVIVGNVDLLGGLTNAIAEWIDHQ